MSQEILTGWKDIASYLGKGVRTVQRYERGLGLPVRRPTGKSTGSVIATKAELGAWILASPVRAAFQLNQPTLHDAALLREFRQNVETLRRLREESKCRREELLGSLELLKTSIRSILPERDHGTSLELRLLAEALTSDPARNQAH
jgi:transcriptional regulator with XRE-family HTH domain